jgi:hypothetical protein
MKKIIKYTILIILLYIWVHITSYAASINTDIDISALAPWVCTWKSCTVTSWSDAISWILWWIIKYTTFIVWLLAVLFIVINWIMYSMWGMDQSMKEESKKRIIKTLIWIIILLMSGTILNILAPWIYR